MSNQLLTVTTHQGPVSLATSRWGSGPVVILLHGWLHSKEIWGRIAPLLSHDFRLIAIDLPGFGDSPPVTKDAISISEYAHVINLALAALDGESKILGIVADSLSGVILANAASLSSFPSVRSLAFSGCPFDGLPTALKIPMLSSLLTPGLALLHRVPEPVRRALVRRLANYTLYEEIDSDEIMLGVAKADTTSARVLFDALRYKVPLGASGALRRHRCLVLRGEHDPIASKAESLLWAGYISAPYVEISGSSHVPMIEQPAAYANILRSFLNEFEGPSIETSNQP